MTLSKDNQDQIDHAAESLRALLAEGYDVVSVVLHKDGLIGVTAQNEDEPWAYARTVDKDTRTDSKADQVEETVRVINEHREEAKNLEAPDGVDYEPGPPTPLPEQEEEVKD